MPIGNWIFRGDRIQEGLQVRAADRNEIGPWVFPNSHDGLTGLRCEAPVNDDIPKETQ